MLKMRQKMLKMMPLKPKAYMTVTAAMWKRERMIIVDPSGGIPSVNMYRDNITSYRVYCFYARCNFL